MGHPGFLSSVSLITSGVPKEIVFGSDQTYPPLDVIEREAWLIAVGIVQGVEWDWGSWCWKKRNPG